MYQMKGHFKGFPTLVEIAWTFYMLHGNLQANFLQNTKHSGFRNSDEILLTPHLFKTANCEFTNESSFQELLKTCNLLLLLIPDTEKNSLKRPKPLSQSYTGNIKKSGCNFAHSNLYLSLSLFQQPYDCW